MKICERGFDFGRELQNKRQVLMMAECFLSKTGGVSVSPRTLGWSFYASSAVALTRYPTGQCDRKPLPNRVQGIAGSVQEESAFLRSLPGQISLRSRHAAAECAAIFVWLRRSLRT